MKVFSLFISLLFLPVLSWASTHVVNQSFFINSKPDETWSKKDRIIVLGSERVDIRILAKARKKFPRAIPIFWILGDDQWNYKNISLSRDQKVIDFANQLAELYIQVLPENLCPQPAIFHEKTHDILVIDPSWFLFPHQAELFNSQCTSLDIGRFYADIEEAILNAKFKPIVMISTHGIHPKLTTLNSDDSLVRWAQNVQQSIGAINGISNPAYQKFQDKLTKWISRRDNILFVSADSDAFFHDSSDSLHHLAMPRIQPDELDLVENKTGVVASAKELSEPIQLQFNEKFEEANTICNEHTGPMYDFKLSGKTYEYFLGKNYRKLWNLPIAISCFNLEKENLTVDRIGGSLRSPDFLLKDKQGNFFTLRPLKREIRMPDILRDTIVEHVLLDQQSSLHPLGYILADALSKQIGFPSESPKLVYIDVNQKAFAAWKDKEFKSGFYQFLQQPSSILKDPYWQSKGVLEVITMQEMVHRLESESYYRLDQEAYLKARLFDMLIGDWDRQRDEWYWMVIPEGKYKVFRPFPIDRDAAFYRGDGVVSWWRKRKWINYKLQDYGKKLKRPEPMMIQSLSMDHRYMSNLKLEQWNKIVEELQAELPPDSMEKAFSELPVEISKEDKQWLVQAFQKRLKELPQIAGKMRLSLRTSVDVIGTADQDRFIIQSGPGHLVHVTGASNGDIIYSDTFDPHFTKEIRVYGLSGDDAIKLNWPNYTATKIRLIPGTGNDKIIATNQHIKPKVLLYDDDLTIDSYYGYTKTNYELMYNDE
jgi:hypothetical protein